ncbi:MAG: hypothetical protein AB7S26_40735 [Sandaracinaceae bacterium]
MSAPRSPLTTIALGSLALVIASCGARTTLDDFRESAGPTPSDAGRRDAGARDAGRRDAGGPDAGPAGTPCLRDADCGLETLCTAARAFTPVDLAPHPLECGATGPGLNEGGACVTSDDCTRRLCSLPGVCVEPCVSDDDCQPEERCRQTWVRTGTTMMQPLQACTAYVVAPMGVRVTGPEPAESVDPATTTSVALPTLAPNALVVWTSDDDTWPFVVDVRDDDPPSTIIFDSSVSGSIGQPAPAWGIGSLTVGGDSLTVLYPNGALTPSPMSGFTFSLSSLAATRLTRVVAQRSNPGVTLDIDVYLVGGQDLRSPDGSVPPVIRQGVQAAGAILASTGLMIGDVRVHEVVGQLRQRYAILEMGSSPTGWPEELPALYRLSAGANRPSVAVFYAREIDGALGIASGIPGVQILPGTGSSGVALAGDMIRRNELGMVMAHEIGHYMGLFHSSELDGSVNDPHPDTPECRADRDTDGDGLLAPFECAGAGGDNLMFWAGQGTVISPGQAEIMRRAYFVR